MGHYIYNILGFQQTAAAVGHLQTIFPQTGALWLGLRLFQDAAHSVLPKL